MHSELTVSCKATIRDALAKISVNGRQIVMCVNGGRVIGTITDGDIRRAILGGMEPGDSIESICNRDFIFVNTYDENNIRNLMERHSIRHIPHLNDNMELTGLYTYEDIAGRINDTAVMVFAGGEGRRMRPVTLETPKPLLNVGSKTAIELILDRIISQNINDIYIALHYKSSMIRDNIAENYPHIEEHCFISEENPMGTAGALFTLRDKHYEHIITHNSDVITDINLRMMLNMHKNSNNDITASLIPLIFRLPYGIADIDDKSISQIKEKPQSTYLVMSGVNILKRDALEPLHGQHMGMDELIRHSIENHKRVGYYIHRGLWADIGEMKQYLTVQKAFRGS